MNDTSNDDDPRRTAILRQARRHFMTRGFASTRIEPIAREAAVSTATLYTYFQSKDDLFAAVIVSASDAFAAQMAKVTHGAEGPARDQILQFALAYANFMGDPFVRSVFRLVMAERPRFREVAEGFFEKGRSDFGAPLIACLTRLCEAGELSIEKRSWAAGQLMGMIEHPVFFVPLITGDDVHVARAGNQIAEDAVTTFLARYGASQG
ncbi:MAG: TetR/AcrR family transcriptional regulator [Alphaproteobacteria bacterium]|nr:MAG: TetR/AcrR family transcriptional regulator [Alphaproteobacteria bacterium]PZO39483.1 MAG: TetR/AcrR family transcriptional regulator [Alphaproteobacteria bacterium]